jgi:hypothetical protein
MADDDGARGRLPDPLTIEIEPRAAYLRQFKGAPAFPPLTDDELTLLAEWLTPKEKARLDQRWRERRDAPLEPVIAEARKLVDDRPRRLEESPGRPGGLLGANRRAVEVSRQWLRRVYALACEARAAQLDRVPAVDHVAVGLARVVVFVDGPLAGFLYRFDVGEDVCAAFHRAGEFMASDDDARTSDAGRALQFTASAWNALHPQRLIKERHLRKQLEGAAPIPA